MRTSITSIMGFVAGSGLSVVGPGIGRDRMQSAAKLFGGIVVVDNNNAAGPVRSPAAARQFSHTAQTPRRSMEDRA